MKTLIILSFILQSIIPPNANRIIVKGNIDKTIDALLKQDFKINVYIPDLKVLKCEKRIEGNTFKVEADIAISGDSVYISGTCIVDRNYLVDRVFSFSAANEKGNNVAKYGFKQLNELALSIDSNLTYKTVR